MAAAYKQEKEEFLRANSDLPLGQPGVSIRIIEFPKGKLSVSLTVDYSTSYEEIKTAIPLLLSWRDRLRAYQLPHYLPESTSLLLIILAERKKGKTYREIARWLNYSFYEYLEEYAQFVRIVIKQAPKVRTGLG